MNLCVACGKYPPFWRSFCYTCCQWLGVAWRKRITDGGTSERRRAVEALRAHYASVRTFGGGRRQR